MAQKTEVTEAQYVAFEEGKVDLPFSFLHKCALTFGIDMKELFIEMII